MFSLNENRIKDLDNKTHLHSIPLAIADDMVDLLDSTDFFDEPALDMTAEDYINGHRVIDISCKSGSLLFSFYKRFMVALRNVFPDRDDRELFIMRYLLYGLCPDKRYLDLVRSTFYSNKKYDLTNEFGNFYHYNFEDQRGVDKEEVKELLENMRFDVVCGNPPYNDDMYLDFVMLGHKLAKSYDLWITPAKFIGKESDMNDIMRNNLCPFIQQVLYYPQHTDIFNIMLRGGLAIYLVDKSVHTEKLIINISKTCKSFNSTVSRELGTTLLNIGYNMDRHLENVEKLSSCVDLNKRFYVNEYENGDKKSELNTIEIVQGGKGVVGYISKDKLKTTRYLDKYKVVFPSMCGAAEIDNNGRILGLNEVYILSPNQITKGGYPILKFFDSYDEAVNFRAYMFTKFFRFLYYFRVTGSNINASFFDSVPELSDYTKVYEDKPLEGYTPDENGIYTDINGVVHCSLYARYKLSDEEINVIESVIRERK